ncbi:MAG: hypothetical protein QHH19_03385 [Candidatus Thermoplasmatota archaeon]|jgi:hypothetical protein|nr:hypothetical protein [Candidatus Thermoplasmatota archaeon]
MEEEITENKQTAEGMLSVFFGILLLVLEVLSASGLITLILFLIVIILGAKAWHKKDKLGLIGLILGVISIILSIYWTVYVYISGLPH